MLQCAGGGIVNPIRIWRPLALSVLLLGLLSACSPYLVAIGSFTASPDTIVAGSVTELTWTLDWSVDSPFPSPDTEHRAVITPGDIDVTGSTVLVVAPDETTTYTLTVTRLDATVSAQTTVTVTQSNRAPVADDQSVDTPEDTPLAITLGGSDADGDPLTFSVTGGPAAGTLSGTAPDLTYTPDPGVNGVDSFTFVADDGQATSAEATVTITVDPVNDPPQITSDGGGAAAALSIPENSTAVTDIQASDPEGESEGAGLGYALSGGADQGAFTVDAGSGVLAFAVAPDFENPTDVGGDNVYEVEVAVTDSGGASDRQLLSVTVTDVVETAPPVAEDDAVGATVGAVTNVAAPGLFADNGSGADDLGAPSATLASFGAGSLGGVVTDNAAGATVAIPVLGGTLTVNVDGSVVVSNPTTTGVFTFAYRIDNGVGTSDATVTVTVSQAPIAQDDGYTFLFSADQNVAAGAGLFVDNGSGADGLGTPSATLTSFGGGSLGGAVTDNAAGASVALAGGTLTVNADGSWSLAGQPFTSGTYTFDYRLTNAFGTSDATVTVTIQQPPTAQDDGYAFLFSADQNVAAGAGLFVDNGSGADDLGTPSATLVSFGGGSLGGAVTDNAAGASVALAGGTLTVNADGSWSLTGQPFTPGTYTFDYRLTNVVGTSDATVTLTIQQPPTAQDDGYTFLFSADQNVAAGAGLFVDNGSGADSLGNPVSTLTSFGGGSLGGAVTDNAAGASVALAGGTLTVNADGSWSLTGQPFTPGTHTFDYRLTNVVGTSDATVTLTIQNLPTANDDSATVTEDDPATTIDVIGNDSNAGAASITSVTQPTNGTVVITNAGADLTYDPDTNDCNDGTPTDDFTYTLTPGGSTATVAVTVTCENDPPTVTGPGPFGVLGNVSIAVTDGADDLLAGANDVDGDTPFVGGTVPTASTNGGSVSINTATGTFTYDPPAGFTGADTFDYQVCDASVCTAAETVTLNVSGTVWFLDNTAGVGDGRLGSPFNTLAAFQAVNNNTGSNPGNGDCIFVHSGSGDYTGGTTLLTGQRLIGQGSTASLASVCSLTVPTYSASLPSVNGTDPTISNAAGNGVTLGSGNTVRGLTIGNTSGTGISGSNFGTLTASDVTINGTGKALDLTTGTMAATFDSVGTSSSTSGGVSLSGLSGTTTFNGVAITTTGGTGFAASNAGTLTISGSANTIASTNGTALDVSNTTIGASDLTFRSISSSNGGNVGIRLDTTGSSGGLTVTGTGSAGTGGTISNKTGANGSTSSGIGIFLNSTRDVSLSWMQLNGFSNFAIRGITVTNFSLLNSVVSGTNGDSAANDEGSISFDNLLGSASVTSSSVSGGLEDNIVVTNTSGTLNRLTVSNSTIGLNNTSLGNEGILVEAKNSATANLTVTGTTFLGSRGDHIQTNALNSSSMDVVIQDNTFQNAHPSSLGAGVTISGGGTGASPTVTYNVSGTTVGSQTFRDAVVASITVNPVSGGGTYSGTIQNNAIGVSGQVGSGGAEGIFVGVNGTATHTTLVNNNTVVQVDNFAGIDVLANNASTMNATITNNTVDNLDPFAFVGINTIVGGTGAGDTSSICADIRSNTLDAGDVFGFDIFIDQSSVSASYRFPGYVGVTSGGAALDAFLAGQNTLVSGFQDSLAAANVTGTGTTCP
jgi:hypothetical protein